jgi:phenylacetate-CoA ligase
MQNSPFYQRKYAEAGVNLTNINRIEDLAQLPLTTKDELRSSQEEAPALGLHAAIYLAEYIREKFKIDTASLGIQRVL